MESPWIRKLPLYRRIQIFSDLGQETQTEIGNELRSPTDAIALKQ